MKKSIFIVVFLFVAGLSFGAGASIGSGAGVTIGGTVVESTQSTYAARAGFAYQAATSAVAGLANAFSRPNGGSESFSLDANSNLVITTRTKTSSVVVTGNSGGDYNGPPSETVFELTGWDITQWGWAAQDGFFLYRISDNQADVFAPGTFGVYRGADDWRGGLADEGPYVVGALTGEAVGEMTLDWVYATTVTTNFASPPEASPSEGAVVYLVGAADSYSWSDAGPLVVAGVTNGAATSVSLGLYGGRPWAGVYTQYTNAQQGRVYVTSVSAEGEQLASLRFLYRAYNAADTIDVEVFETGAAEAFLTNTLACTNSETIHEVTVTGIDRYAPPGFVLKATVKATAETEAGSWTTLPAVEAMW